MKILLDFAGNVWGGKELPIFSNNLDANVYLSELRDDIYSYFENRILVTQLIQKLGGAVASIPWYRNIDFTLYLNNYEQQQFTGTLKNRFKQAHELELTSVIRISILGAAEDAIYLGSNAENLYTAENIAYSLQMFGDLDLELPNIKVMVPDSSSVNYIERLLYREVVEAQEVEFVSIVFAVKDNGTLADILLEEKEVFVRFIAEAIEQFKEKN